MGTRLLQRATTVLTQSALSDFAPKDACLVSTFGTTGAFFSHLGHLVVFNHWYDHKQEITFEWPYFIMTYVG